jgi:pimeloyl-ACP methyl ester carboxylesterase
VYLIGHSRGGIISANYASHNPTDIRAVINLAGAYNQFCDPQNGNYSWTIVDDSVGHKRQRWIYYQHDSFFGVAYRAKVKEASLRAGLQYFEIPGNHAAPLLRPGWIPGALKWFESLQ